MLVTAGAACAVERERAPGCEGDDCGVHPAGILDPGSPSFHANELERRDWDISLCTGCHGADLAGGAGATACSDCHEDGATACATCHSDTLEGGAHPAHLSAGAVDWGADCGACHDVPQHWADEGHILRGGVADPRPAEVVFADLAAHRPPFADEGAGAPSYDAETATCSGVYCHGATLGAGGALTEPVWTGGADQAACGSCHGAPPPSHAEVETCRGCHPGGDAVHVDGALQLGEGDDCSGCHGSAESPAPPQDLSGNVLSSAIGVGAHRAHVQAPRRLRGPLECSECHPAVSSVDSPGHIDTPLPAEVTLVGGGSWDRDQATCDTWCHGDSEPVWTRVGEGEVFCGSCHGVPPASPPHTGEMMLSDCAGCHPDTVDAFGNILRSGPPGAETSEHMDGETDAL